MIIFPSDIKLQLKNKRSRPQGWILFHCPGFVDAITKGVKPAVHVYEACEWTAVGLLSELSVINGGKAIDMPDFRKASSWEDQIVKI